VENHCAKHPKNTLGGSGSKNYCSKFPSEAGTKTDQRKTPTALTKLSSQKLSTKVFGLRNGGYPSPRFNNKHPENDSFIENS
jgi:hypothetical protein